MVVYATLLLFTQTADQNLEIDETRFFSTMQYIYGLSLFQLPVTSLFIFRDGLAFISRRILQRCVLLTFVSFLSCRS
jgi:hypothetical protein